MPLHRNSSSITTRQQWPICAALLAGLVVSGCASGDPRDSDTLPADIARALQTDRAVLDCRQGNVDGHSAFQPGWVISTRVDLNDDGRPDWLLRGVHACLSGEDSSDYWLYLDASTGRKLLGVYRGARALEVLPGVHRGFHDLRIVDGMGAQKTIQFGTDGYPEDPPSHRH